MGRLLSSFLILAAFAQITPELESKFKKWHEDFQALGERFKDNAHFNDAKLNDFRDGGKSAYIRSYETAGGKNKRSAQKYPYGVPNNKAPLNEKALKQLPGFSMLDESVYLQARLGYEKIVSDPKLKQKYGALNKRYLTIVDFGLPANERQFFVIDMDKNEVVINTYTTLGIGPQAKGRWVPPIDTETGIPKDDAFGNDFNSKRSSVGFYLTAKNKDAQSQWALYGSGKGEVIAHVLRLNGLDPKLNSNANARGVIVHPFERFSTQERLPKGGYAPPILYSEGCPALPFEESGEFYGFEDKPLSEVIIDLIKGQSVFYIHSDSKDPKVDIRKNSEFLRVELPGNLSITDWIKAQKLHDTTKSDAKSR